MKNLIIILGLLCCFTNSSYGQSSENDLLKGIEQKINTAFSETMRTKSNAPLIELQEELKVCDEKSPSNLTKYWQAYLSFYNFVYHNFTSGDKESEKKVLKEGIDLLKDMKDKSAEDYALLAKLQGPYMQFEQPMRMGIVSMQISRNFKKAFKLEPDNLRLNLAFASHDFHTPKEYGGGKQTEEYLLKALALPAQKKESEYLPSWGKEEVYEMLVKFYMRENKMTEAKKYLEEGLSIFPNNYTLSQLRSQLKE